MPTATFQRRHRAKLVARVGPAAVVELPWFKKNDYQWARHVLIPGVPRPAFPAHITTAQYPGFFEEIARLKMWRQRKHAGVAKPALGLWAYGRLPAWASSVSKAMDHANVPQPRPEPPTPPAYHDSNPKLSARAQQIMFYAWRPDVGHWRSAFTADVNVSGNQGVYIAQARAAAAQTSSLGFEVAAWANQSQVGIQHLVDFGEMIDADYLIWQAETIGEMADVGVEPDGSIRGGSPVTWGDLVLIGNANAWTHEQRATVEKLIVNGKLRFIQETYTNEGDPWPNQFGTQGVQAASICPGVGWGRSPYQLPAYQPYTPHEQWEKMCLYIDETINAQSRSIMPW